MSTHSHSPQLNPSREGKCRLYLMDEFRLVSGEVPPAASGSEYGYMPWDLRHEKAAVNSAGSFPGAQKQKIYQKSAELMNHLDFVVSWLMQLLTI